MAILGAVFAEAPVDGTPYVRQDSGWVAASSGGGSQSLMREIVLMDSATWSPPFECTAIVTVIGGGGGGGRAGTAAAGDKAVACGGGAGGTAISVLNLSPATSYTATIGAGGAGITDVAAGGQYGSPGGNTSFSGSDIDTMTGNGGDRGNFARTNQSSGARTATGATGGTATGGTVGNITGGGSGDAIGADTGANKQGAATGGGAPGVQGVGHSSGTADCSTVINARVTTSGAGVGGGSADVTATSSSIFSSSPGDAFGYSEFPSTIKNRITFADEQNEAYFFNANYNGIFNLYGTPAYVDAIGKTMRSGPGSGGKAINSLTSENTGSTSVHGARLFGGGGSALKMSNVTQIAGNGGIGAGGGGATQYSGTGNLSSGDGGQGIVVIQITGVSS